MKDAVLQQEVVKVVADATADQMYPGDPTGAAIIRQNVAIVASLPAGAELFGQMLRDAHAVLIGDQDGPVVVPPEQLVQITRDERASSLPALSIEVPKVTVLDVASGVLGWLVPLSGIVAVVCYVLTFLARPERGALFRTLGIGLGQADSWVTGVRCGGAVLVR